MAARRRGAPPVPALISHRAGYRLRWTGSPRTDLAGWNGSTASGGGRPPSRLRVAPPHPVDAEPARAGPALGDPAGVETRFLALSVSDAAEDVIAVVRAGARGYVTKSISGDDLVDAIIRVIARQLTISIKTVETHVSAVLRKLQLSNRHELSRWAAARRIW